MEKIKLRNMFICTLHSYDIDGKLEDVISTLNNKLKEFKDLGYDNITIERERYSEDSNFDIHGDRFETDEEFERRKRLNEENELRIKQLRQQLKEEERKTYERLKKKFEKNTPKKEKPTPPPSQLIKEGQDPKKRKDR